ncbi:uncharacterized protein LOC132194292 [Neocloeon triangulifer]|uniref:uncharacterized protein LOC132194292 n=1 Tax=Neocloeon triangulifer TaxID=2078957 RepID=UPI00286F7F03|nr:uncharacterized protein LOC132194292 [Neocloeon triangulifer]
MRSELIFLSAILFTVSQAAVLDLSTGMIYRLRRSTSEPAEEAQTINKEEQLESLEPPKANLRGGCGCADKNNCGDTVAVPAVASIIIYGPKMDEYWACLSNCINQPPCIPCDKC